MRTRVSLPAVDEMKSAPCQIELGCSSLSTANSPGVFAKALWLWIYSHDVLLGGAVSMIRAAGAQMCNLVWPLSMETFL